MYRAPTDDSDSDIDTSAHEELRAARPVQPAPMAACSLAQRISNSPLFTRTRSNPLTTAAHASTTTTAAAAGSRFRSSNLASAGQPQPRRGSSSSGQHNPKSLKRSGLGESPSHSAKRMLSGIMSGCTRSSNAAQHAADNNVNGLGSAREQRQQQQEHSGVDQVNGYLGVADLDSNPAAAAAATIKPDVLHHLQHWATRLQQQQRAASAGGNKRHRESVVETTSVIYESEKLGAAAGIAKFQQVAAAAAAVDGSSDDQQPSAPPIACLFAEQQQQCSHHNPQPSTSAAAAAEVPAGSSSALKRRQQQQDHQQQQQPPRCDVENCQQQQQEWRWPSSRERAQAANPSAGDNPTDLPVIDLTNDAAAAGSRNAAAHADKGTKVSPQQQQQQLHKRGAVDSSTDAFCQLHSSGEGSAKRQHTAAAVAEGDVDVDVDMPQAAYLTHKRQQPDERSWSPSPDPVILQQQQKGDAHAHKLARHDGWNGVNSAASGGGAAAGSGGGPVPMDSAQQLSPLAAAAAGMMSSSNSSNAVMQALQQAYPPLAAVLCAVRSGGLSAVLNSPYGGAVSAIMTQPAGQRLLNSFAELAADESLMAAALQHYQQQQQQGSIPCAQNVAGCSYHLGLSPTAAAVVGLASPTVQQALHDLQVGIASSQAAAAAALLSDLDLAFNTYQHGLQVGSRVGIATQQQQQQQQQQLLAELQSKLRVAEQQLQQQQKERQATEAAAAAAQQALHEAKEKLEQVTLCQICYEQPRDTVLMPCMHFLYCAKCMQQSVDAAAAAARSGKGECVVRCPVCRAAVSGQVVVHLSPQAADTVGG